MDEMDYRLRELEQRFAAKEAADIVRDKHLDETLAKFSKTAETLTAALNQGRGMIWLIGIIATASATIGGFVGHWLGMAQQ